MYVEMCGLLKATLLEAHCNVKDTLPTQVGYATDVKNACCSAVYFLGNLCHNMFGIVHDIIEDKH